VRRLAARDTSRSDLIGGWEYGLGREGRVSCAYVNVSICVMCVVHVLVESMQVRVRSGHPNLSQVRSGQVNSSQTKLGTQASSEPIEQYSSKVVISISLLPVHFALT